MAKREPAFPCHNDEGKQYNYNHNGMDLRDYFAVRALQAMLTNPNWDGYPSEFASTAYGYADAMMEARRK